MRIEDIPLRTRQVARLLGVSSSTVKRWVDQGDLPAARTVGKHRLITMPEVIRFAKRQGLPLPDAERLAGIAAGRDSLVPVPFPFPILQPDAEDVRERDRLKELLIAGQGPEVRDWLLSAYANGRNAVELVDGWISPVMAEIGVCWRRGDVGVDQEHRASRILYAVVLELTQQILSGRDVKARYPKALGATPEQDLYLLPGLVCEWTLCEHGWDAVNLGANLPITALADAVRRERPQLVWLSVHHVEDQARFLQGVTRLHAALVETGAVWIVGGYAVTPELQEILMTKFSAKYGTNVADLAAFARPVAERFANRPAFADATSFSEKLIGLSNGRRESSAIEVASGSGSRG